MYCGAKLTIGRFKMSDIRSIKKICFTEIDEALLDGFREICADAGLAFSDTTEGAYKVAAVNGKEFSIQKINCDTCTAELRITYTQKVEFFRACSMLSSFIDSDDEIIKQIPNDSMLCLMADMSRNAVYNIPTAKKMLRLLALIGFNSLMLYTEDTYELPGYKYFGHMRGRFSKDELKEIDDYAFMLGIEVIPCVQALAHLATALRWPDFNGYRDTKDILLVGHEKTYAFIQAILDVCAECFRSRKINLGMDEAFELGRGQYLSAHGYRPPHELMLEHLDRVVDMCRNSGFAPMIWSDMFFRMAFNGAYRVREGELPNDVLRRIPEGLTLIYWDYYSLDSQIFTHMLDCHLKSNNPVAFAGGAWKWSGFAPHNRFSLVSSKMQLDVCAEKGVKNMIVTAWGDNGGEASQFAPLPTLLYFAERVYNGYEVEVERLEARALECFGIGYEALLTLDAPNELPGITIEAGWPLNPSRYMLYNDPLEGIMDRHFDPETAPAAFAAAAERLDAYRDNENFGYVYRTLSSLCRFLSLKCDVSERLRTAYIAGDKETLARIRDDIPAMVDALDDFISTFRKQWFTENKTFGFTNTELRLGGLKQRLISTRERVDAYLNGDAARIEELEQPSLSTSGNPNRHYVNQQRWGVVATVGVM